MSRRKRETADDVPRQRPQPSDLQWFVLAAAGPLALCASKLGLDLWGDEAYTLIHFVSKPWSHIATDYSAPNNHVFYSLLLRPVYLVSGSDFVLRLPSFLFTALTLAMVFRLARRLAGIPTAVTATLALGLTQMFLIHTMEIRGYGLSMFVVVWLADLALPDAPGIWWRRPAAIVLVGAGLLYVLPTNVFFLIPLAMTAVVYAAVRDRRMSSALVESAAWIAAVAVAGLLYLPIVDGLLAARGEPASSPVAGAVGLAGQVFSAAVRDWLPILPVVGLGLLWWGRQVAGKRSGADRSGRAEAGRETSSSAGRSALMFLIVAMLVVPFVLTALAAVLPFPRNFCPVLPFLALAIGHMTVEALAAVGRLFGAKWSQATVAATGMVLLAAVAVPRIVTYSERLTEYRRGEFAQDGYFNYYAANFHPAEVAEYLARSIGPDESYVMCFAKADHHSLSYYMDQAGLPLKRTGDGSPSVVYLITPELVDYDELSVRFGISSEVQCRLPLVHDFGYYRLQRFNAEWNESAE